MVIVCSLTMRPECLRSVTSADLTGLLNKRDLLWVDFAAPTKTEVKLLAELFNFHHLSIQDCLDDVHYPKVEQFPNYLFVILHTLEQERGSKFATTEVDFFLTTKALVTVHKRTSRVLETVRQHLLDGALSTALAVDLLFHTIASRFIDEYFPVVEELDKEIDVIEDQVFRSQGRMADGGNAVTVRFLSTKKRLVGLKRLLTPQRDVFTRLARNEFPQVAATTVAYFRDIYDRLFRLTELLDSYRDVLSSTLEAYLSVVSNRLNQVMKVLTVVTVIILPLTLITGIYGMNFHFMPELSSPWGYPGALASMAVVGLSLAWYFRHRGWL